MKKCFALLLALLLMCGACAYGMNFEPIQMEDGLIKITAATYDEAADCVTIQCTVGGVNLDGAKIDISAFDGETTEFTLEADSYISMPEDLQNAGYLVNMPPKAFADWFNAEAESVGAEFSIYADYFRDASQTMLNNLTFNSSDFAHVSDDFRDNCNPHRLTVLKLDSVYRRDVPDGPEEGVPTVHGAFGDLETGEGFDLWYEGFEFSLADDIVILLPPDVEKPDALEPMSIEDFVDWYWANEEAINGDEIPFEENNDPIPFEFYITFDMDENGALHRMEYAGK